MTVSIELVAKACHEANRILCESVKDFSQKSWEDAEQWQRDSAIRGVSFLIMNPNSTPRDQHEAWRADKLKDGWKYGPMKDPSRKEHPCMVGYDQLPLFQQTKDAMFQAIARALLGIRSQV